MARRLEQAFREDHRDLIRGLHALRAAVAGNDLARAANIAAGLDARAGAHMAFEETVFYPALGPILGREFVAGMYREHATGRRALNRISALADATRFDEADRQSLLTDLDGTLEHALSCGTLLSYIKRFDAAQIADFEDQLARLEARAPRWSDLPLAPEPTAWRPGG